MLAQAPTILKGPSTKTNVPGNNATCSVHILRYRSPYAGNFTYTQEHTGPKKLLLHTILFFFIKAMTNIGRRMRTTKKAVFHCFPFKV